MDKVICFGEVLWDCFPDGRRLGGAPFNVAYHLKKFGLEPIMVSAVGNDELGQEALDIIRSRGLRTDAITVHDDLPTGVVDVTLSESGEPSYTIREKVAWDRITVSESLLAEAADCKFIVYGSLALREEPNRPALGRLLNVPGPRAVFDVNLRAPFDDKDRVLRWAQRAFVLKLNDSELGALTGYGADVVSALDTPNMKVPLTDLADATGASQICVTRGPDGVAYYNDFTFLHAPAPSVEVTNTVGAGDAFTARFIVGLNDPAQSEDLPALLQAACELGAFVTTCDGAQPDYEVREDAEEA